MAGKPKVTRILHSRGLHRAKYDRLHDMAALCGRVRADAWQRCSGLSTAQQSVYEIRNAWMAEGYGWHGLPARLGKATLSDALGDIAAARDAAKVSVKKAIRHKTRGDGAERHRLYSLLKRNRWDEDPFLHRQMRRKWQGGTSRVTHQIVARVPTPPRSGMDGPGSTCRAWRPAHRHPAARHTLADRNPADRSAGRRPGGDPLRHRRDRRMQHEALRGWRTWC